MNRRAPSELSVTIAWLCAGYAPCIIDHVDCGCISFNPVVHLKCRFSATTLFVTVIQGCSGVVRWTLIEDRPFKIDAQKNSSFQSEIKYLVRLFFDAWTLVISTQKFMAVWTTSTSLWLNIVLTTQIANLLNTLGRTLETSIFEIFFVFLRANLKRYIFYQRPSNYSWASL
jgi:hypothetical protein